jgi:hypothetical protein
MKMPVVLVLLLAWLAQTAGQALNVTTLSLIVAFTEQARATSSVLFFCWSPAGKIYRTFLFPCSWARQLSRMSQMMWAFTAQSCCALGDNKLHSCSTVFVLFQTEKYSNVRLGNKRVENLYCAASVRQLHAVKYCAASVRQLYAVKYCAASVRQLHAV